MSSDIKTKAISGFTWTFIEAIGTRGMQFAVSTILARLLMPEQFGLIGMLTIFIVVSQAFIDSGFGTALIQKQEITEKDKCTVFYFNTITSVVITLLLFLAAPFIASFYNQPVLSKMLRILSLTLIISSFGLVHNFILRKDLNFKAETKLSIVAITLSGIIGIILAYYGFGVWSLIIQQLSNAFFRTIQLWLYSSWRPGFVFSINSLKDMFRFSSKILFSGILKRIFDNIYLVIIGKLFCALDLGFYTRAHNLQRLPSNTITSMITRVTFPVFSAIQNDRAKVKNGIKKSVVTLVLINFPLMIGSAAIARPFIQVLLTEKWLPSVPFFQVLCISSLLLPVYLINISVLQAVGHPEVFLKIELIKNTLIILNIIFTWKSGILAIITGHAIITLLCYYISLIYIKKYLEYSVCSQIRDIIPFLSVSIIMGGIMYSMNFLFEIHDIILLIIQVITGTTVYIFLCNIFKFNIYIEIQRNILNKIGQILKL